MLRWLRKSKSLRKAPHEDIPFLITDGLRDCQIEAIINLEKSFVDARPKALVQMATGSGKTFTAITSVYRLLKHVKAERILFLVDTKTSANRLKANSANTSHRMTTVFSRNYTG